MESKTVRVEVTMDDIAHGERHSCTQCPIARALKRQGHMADPSVDGLYIQDDERGMCGRTPSEANQFIQMFDDGCHVEPFAFDLTLERE